MADDLRRRGLQPRDPRDDSQYSKQEDDDRLRTQPPQHHRSNGSNMAAAGPITLPSIHDYPPTAQRGPPPPHDQPRSAYSLSPTDSDNGPPPPGQAYHLPPVHAIDGRGPPPPPPQDPRHLQASHRPAQAEPRNGYYPGPPPPPRQGGYPQDGGYAPVYTYHQGPPGAIMGPFDYRNVPNAQQASAPRQRTSIACRYCRKRKIRCSGYQTTADGKCMNCKKTGNDCVFQPVSSGTTAFVPVSAIPGGVAPGTQLFGAFGQPLGPPPGPGGPHNGPPHHLQPPHPMQQPHQMQTPPQMPLPSPTGSYYDERMEGSRRRPRGPEDDHQHGPRLPPPHPHQQEEDPRRRSPASAQSSTPPTVYHAYSRNDSSTPPTAPYHHQPHPLQHLQHQQAPPHLQAHHQQTDRPMPGHYTRRDSPGAAPQPPHIQQGPPPPPQAPRQPSPHQATSPSSKGIMSLSALIDHKSGPSSSDPRGNNIDNSMLGRLNGRR